MSKFPTVLHTVCDRNDWRKYQVTKVWE